MKPKSIINAVIYARYSSSNQREESIEGQIRECQDYASKNNYVVVNEYIDRAISGTTDKRPSFQQLIADSKKHNFKAVITYTIDRFARNRYDSAVYKNALKKNGVKVVYAKQPISDDPEGVVLESVLEGYAEYYSKNLARNIKRGLRENALKAMSTGNIALGYKTGANKQYEIEPVGASIVKWIFNQYAAGVPASKIVQELNRQGHKTSRGNVFNLYSLPSILTNKTYIGVYSYKDIEIEDAVPPIISKELFERVQNMRKRNTRKASAKAKEKYVLTGKLFCGYCGKPMVGESVADKYTTYRYYGCSGKRRLYNCTKKNEKKDWLERIVVEYTVNHVLTDDNIDAISTKAMELYQKEMKDNSMLSTLQASLRETNKKINNIMNAIAQGIVTSTTKQWLEEAEEEKKDIEFEIAKEKIKIPPLSKEMVEYFLSSFKDGDINDIEFRGQVVNTLINSIYLYDKDDNDFEMKLIFNTSFDNTAIISRLDLEEFAKG